MSLVQISSIAAYQLGLTLIDLTCQPQFPQG